MSAQPRHTGSSTPNYGARLKAVPSRSSQGKPRSSAPKRERRPLSLLPALEPTGRRRYVIFILMSILMALVCILLINVRITEHQYDLVQLRSQETALQQEKERLAQEVEFNQAPQNLAVRASQLGMVAATQQATLNLQTGEVNGVPFAVEKVERTSEAPDYTQNMIDPPALYDTEAYDEASKRAAEQKRLEEEEKKKKEAEAKASAAASASAQPSPHASSSETNQQPAAQAPASTP